MTDAVTLTVGGEIHGGWKTVLIDSGIDTLAAQFTVSLADRWPGKPERFALKAGAEAIVKIGADVVISGFIDRLDTSLDANTHPISISGRSRAADLIDCSAVATPGSWRGRKLEEIAAELAKPFGITVTGEVATGAPFKVFALQQGETVFAAIERMLKMRGLLAVSGVDGNVRIVSPDAGKAQAVKLREGRELLNFSASHDVSDRFSDYLVKGQAAGDDNANGKAVAHIKGDARDPGVTRHRPLLIVAEEQGDIATLRKRAAWEATVRAAKAQTVSVEINGWRRPDGKLWAGLDRVDLDAPSALIGGVLLVADVRFELDDRGRRTTLSLARPEAYSQLAIPEEAEASKIGHPKARTKSDKS
jgi:prophage tail gpP-like protein